ncbi:Coq4 family protein [Novosphingobium lentum]|uniref:Coq4 family protein n=1 Tax=Novosphingobium lentum TaxID=145287 RepID=UPI000A042440|nr:Coq4 family protein [Novosphingobium lentum]
MDNASASFAAESSLDEDWAEPHSLPDLPFEAPGRVRAKWRPIKALGHFRNLIRNKEATEEVFHIFESLPRKDFIPAARAFTLSERGRALREREPFLPAILDDHAALRRTPAGSLAHAYCDFMEREGLTAAGLVSEFDKFLGDRPVHHDLLKWYSERQRDTHDLLHILTGYGRDALGEACVLAFTYGQDPSPAHLFIAYLAGGNIRKKTRTQAPVFGAIREAQRLGRACPRIAELTITDLLPLPLDDARRQLGVTSPQVYAQAHACFAAEGRNPYELLPVAA